MTEFCTDKEVLMQGDFNLPSLKWNTDSMFSHYVPPFDMKFYEVFTAAGLSQIVKESMYFQSGSVLDLCLVSHK